MEELVQCQSKAEAVTARRKFAAELGADYDAFTDVFLYTRDATRFFLYVERSVQRPTWWAVVRREGAAVVAP